MNDITEVTNMFLIACATDCVYQKEGYCILEAPTVISNTKNYQNCVHYIKVNSNNFSISKYTADKNL